MDQILLTKACMSSDSTMADVISNLELTGFQVVIIIDSSSKILGIVTDGDIRRGLLKGYGLETSVKDIMAEKPKVVTSSTSRKQAVDIILNEKD